MCDTPTVYGQLICKECKPKLIKIRAPRCFKCGKGLKNTGDELCYDCSIKSHLYDRGYSLYEYNSVCQSIYRFKYKGRAEYADYFGREIAKEFAHTIMKMKPDGIVPVPLHYKKYRVRGYNQAELLAKVISKELNVPCYSKYLVRKINTIPLKKLDPLGRQNNLKNAFITSTDDVKLKRLIIVDDIYTTGSTMNEISRLLRSQGVDKIYFLTLACGEGI